MKNQYVSDFKDYLKYGILRCLAKCGIRTHVCWMLTEDDDTDQGLDLRHLGNPARWRTFDPVLYDHLHDIVCREQMRNIVRIRELKIIPSVTYYESILTDEAPERIKYFEQFQLTLPQCDLVFFDPDTGIERSRPKKGKPDSSKYIYWDELSECYESDHSLLIFQYFNFSPGIREIEARGNEIAENLAVQSPIIAFKTKAQVVFFLVPRPKHFEMMSEFAVDIANHWHPHITFHLVGPAANGEEPIGEPPEPTSQPLSGRRSARPRGKTTAIGYVNRNNQEVIRATGLPGTDHDQYIYVLRCRNCRHQYGANGTDLFQRKCPNCQGGRPGLAYS